MNKLLKKAIQSCCALPITAGMLCLFNCSESKNIVLNNEPTEYISISGAKKLEKGFSSKYFAYIAHQKNSEQFIWKISNERIAKIQSITDNTCEIMPLRLGRAYLTATLLNNPNVATTIQFNVTTPRPRHLIIHGETVAYVNEDQTYTVEYDPEECVEGVKWSVESKSEEEIADITEEGILLPKNKGDVTIKATSKVDDSVVATLDVNIKEERPTAMKIVGPNIIAIGQTVVYTCKCDPQEATQNVIWTLSSDQKYTGQATIEDNGTLTPISEGTVGLIATSTVKPELSTLLEIRIANDVYKVTFSETIGQGFSFSGNPCVITGDDYRATFKSSTAKTKSGVTVPSHKELKNTDIEVLIFNEESYVPSTNFSLVRNILTIPHDAITGDIKINLLGAEISDLMLWEDLRAFSDEDAKTEDKEEAKKSFQVGDYKMVTHKGKEVGYARIIDFYHNQYTAEEKVALATFAFELYKSNEPFGDEYKFDDNASDSVPCFYGSSSLKNRLSALSLDSIDNFSREVEVSIQTEDEKKETKYLRYFLISGKELTNVYPQDLAGHYGLELGYQYAYYTDNYISSRDMWGKIHLDRAGNFFVRSCASWQSEYDPETPRIEELYLVRIEESKSEYSYVSNTSKAHICPLFCI